MNLQALLKIKGVEQKHFRDRMSKAELAANLFRLSQTEERIKNRNVRGQTSLERAAEEVGREVRATMEKISGQSPEHLPLAEHIGEVKKRNKSTNKKIKKIDGKKVESAGD